MKKIILLFNLLLAVTISNAQFPIQISGNDCDGTPHDLYAELDAGKAAVLFFFMDNCGACPPPASVIQGMMNHITAVYPGMVTGYAMPFNDATTCAATLTWVGNYGHQFAPYDSGAYQVAYYGGFGMPTVVVVGGSGANKRVLFSTQSFIVSDTTTMRDSILALFNGNTGISDLLPGVSSFNVYPNPANENVTISLNVKESSNLFIDVADISGKQLAIIMDEKQQGIISRPFNMLKFPDGNYLIRLRVNEKVVTQKVTILH
jgi:hypothetical protein